MPTALVLAACCLTAQLLPAANPWRNGESSTLRRDPPVGGAAARCGDLEFQDAVEQFVRISRPGHRPPEPYRSLLDDLGAPCFKCRDRATGQLLVASAVDLRWLMWGRHDRDPEIRLRCNNLLRDLTRCERCGGRGVCRTFWPDPSRNSPDYDPCLNCGLWPWQHETEPGQCWSCEGRGAAWAKGAFE